MGIFSNIWGGKSPWKSLTTWGLIFYVGVTGLLDEACVQGAISFENCQMWTTWSTNIGVVLGALGLRRAAGGEP